MNLKLKITAVLLVLFSLNVVAAPSLIPAAPQVAAKGYILLDANSGKVIVEQNANEQLEPASLTKMMTAYIADYELEQGNITLDDITTVSKNAWAKNFPGSSLMFLEVGKDVAVRDLLKGVVISSGNDATVALAEHIAGSMDAFADIMNQHAQLLGMNDSHFVNAHGLPADGHRTTARDMATLATAIVIDYPDQYKIYSEKSYRYNNIKQTNRNKLLWRDPSVDGLKTGHTKAAGYCLVASAKKDDMRLIAVVMGARSEEARLRETQKLLSYGFRYYKTRKLFSKGEVVNSVRLWGGAKEELQLIAKDDVYVTVPRSKKDDIKAEMEIDQYIEAPVKEGKQYGDIVIKLDDEVQLKQALVAQETVDTGGIFQLLLDKAELFFTKLIEG